MNIPMNIPVNIHFSGRAWLRVWLHAWQLAVALALAACATSPAPPVAEDTVTVQYAKDVWREDLRRAPSESDATLRAAEQSLTRHVRERAGRVLPEGQKLEISFIRIERAGRVEPWRGPAAYDVRIVRDIYPPRIDLSFRLLAADGSTLASGERELRDPVFLSRAGPYANDPLRFEKALLDDWVRETFPKRR